MFRTSHLIASEYTKFPFPIAASFLLKAKL
jgi:hypothetical protein